MNQLSNCIKQIKNIYILKNNNPTQIIEKDNNLVNELNITKYLKFKKYNDIIEKFNYIFTEEFAHDNKANFIRNIKQLKIKPLKNKEANDSVKGLYDIKKNKIKICLENPNNSEKKIDLEERLMHELLHMSSTKEDERFNGLSYAKKVENRKGYNIIGDGINEGYTEYLNQKYFSRNVNIKYYYLEKVLVAGIENLIGKEKMERLYFIGTFFDFLDEFKQYFDKDENMVDLIFKIDLLRKIDDSEKIKSIFTEAKNEIAELNLKKLNNNYKNDKINYSEYKKEQLIKVDLYKSENFISSDKTIVIEEENEYEIISRFTCLHIGKDKLTINFEPDIKYKKHNK